MEKKGDVLNQMAIISDLLEKLEIEKDTIKVSFDVPKKEFDYLYDKINKVTKKNLTIDGDVFNIRIDAVEFSFKLKNV